ncbi:MAG: hypothetical protein EA417_14685 [Gammaproteobacteria bacterium]|nr:MAG: hypothetical protein EA417_14685 [Gammaproteobacteria bacterium]
MNCIEARQAIGHLDSGVRPEGPLAEHLGQCELCRQHYGDAMLLKTLGSLKVPEPSPQFLEHALQRATDEAAPTPAPAPARTAKWRIPASLAASFLIAAAAMLIWDQMPEQQAIEIVEQRTPAENVVALEAHRQEVRIVIHSNDEHAAAEVSIELAGNLELEGYAGQQRLAWTTSLKQGANLLVLPVVLHNESGEIRVRSQFGQASHEVNVHVARKSQAGRTAPLVEPFAPVNA